MENFAATVWMIASLIGIFIAAFSMAKYFYRQIRNAEIYKAFVYDMAENHLPHIYHELARQSRAMNLDDVQTPPIRFVDLNDRR